MENVDTKLITKDDLDDIFTLSEKSFPAEYNVTKVSLRQKLIDDADKFDEGSLIIREAASGKPIGFIGTKISHSELYPDTGWISIVAVALEIIGVMDMAGFLWKKPWKHLRMWELRG